MSNTAIHTDNAPAAIGPYSQAIQAGNTIYVSGQIPIDPATGAFAGNDIATQTRQSLTNIKAILEAAGADMSNVVKTTVLRADIADRPIDSPADCETWSCGIRKYPITTIAATPRKYVTPESVNILNMSDAWMRQRVYKRYRIAPPLMAALPALLLIANPNMPASIHFHHVTRPPT